MSSGIRSECVLSARAAGEQGHSGLKECVCRWPDNWSNTGLQWAVDWIQAHAAHAVILGKPLILQEWGVHLGQSLPWPQHIHSLQVSLFSQTLSGAMPKALYGF